MQNLRLSVVYRLRISVYPSILFNLQKRNETEGHENEDFRKNESSRVLTLCVTVSFLEKLSLNFSSSSFVIHVDLRHP